MLLDALICMASDGLSVAKLLAACWPILLSQALEDANFQW